MEAYKYQAVAAQSLVVEHINRHYDSPSCIDAVVVAHPDGDHAGGAKKAFRVVRNCLTLDASTLTLC
jgi:beta-lactamase superfamily II metal-dependent hydrolase